MLGHRLFATAIALIYIYTASPAFSQSIAEKIEIIRATVNEFCLSGSNFEFEAKATGEISIKKIAPGADINISTNVKNSRGAVDFIDEKLRASANNDIRECAMPYIKTIVDMLNPATTTGFRIERQSGDYPRSKFTSLDSLQSEACDEARGAAQLELEIRCKSAINIREEACRSISSGPIHRFKFIFSGECVSRGV